MADQPGRIGILDQPGGRRQGAGNADADMGDRPGLGFHVADQRINNRRLGSRPKH